MSNLLQLLKDYFKVIAVTILIYQLFLTIFFFSTENLIILAVIVVICAGYVIVTAYKDDIASFFKK